MESTNERSSSGRVANKSLKIDIVFCSETDQPSRRAEALEGGSEVRECQVGDESRADGSHDVGVALGCGADDGSGRDVGVCCYALWEKNKKNRSNYCHQART